jgi:hypothetical protein
MANKPPSESAITKKVMKYLRSQKDVWATKYPGGYYGENGVPDILGHCCGVFFIIEMKKPGQELTPLQKVKHDQIIRSGGIAIKATSLDEVKQLIQTMRESFACIECPDLEVDCLTAGIRDIRKSFCNQED